MDPTAIQIEEERQRRIAKAIQHIETAFTEMCSATAELSMFDFGSKQHALSNELTDDVQSLCKEVRGNQSKYKLDRDALKSLSLRLSRTGA